MVSIYRSGKPAPIALEGVGIFTIFECSECFALDKFFCAVAASKEGEVIEGVNTGDKVSQSGL